MSTDKVEKGMLIAGALAIFVVVVAIVLWAMNKVFLLLGWHPDTWNLQDWATVWVVIGAGFVGVIFLLYDRVGAWTIVRNAKKDYRLKKAKAEATEWSKDVTLKGEAAFATVIKKEEKPVQMAKIEPPPITATVNTNVKTDVVTFDMKPEAQP